MQKKFRLFVSLMLMMLLITSVSSEAAIVSFTKVHVDSVSARHGVFAHVVDKLDRGDDRVALE